MQNKKSDPYEKDRRKHVGVWGTSDTPKRGGVQVKKLVIIGAFSVQFLLVASIFMGLKVLGDHQTADTKAELPPDLTGAKAEPEEVRSWSGDMVQKKKDGLDIHLKHLTVHEDKVVAHFVFMNTTKETQTTPEWFRFYLHNNLAFMNKSSRETVESGEKLEKNVEIKMHHTTKLVPENITSIELDAEGVEQRWGVMTQ